MSLLLLLSQPFIMSSFFSPRALNGQENKIPFPLYIINTKYRSSCGTVLSYQILLKLSGNSCIKIDREKLHEKS